MKDKLELVEHLKQIQPTNDLEKLALEYCIASHQEEHYKGIRLGLQHELCNYSAEEFREAMCSLNKKC